MTKPLNKGMLSRWLLSGEWRTHRIQLAAAIIAIALVVAMMKKRKAEEHRALAAELRNEAAGQAGGIRDKASLAALGDPETAERILAAFRQHT